MLRITKSIIAGAASDCCGLLLGNKPELKARIGEIHAEHGILETVVATTCPRMLKALRLCGYETLGVSQIFGIERFCY